MTTNPISPERLQSIIDASKPRTTVFSDGSTYDPKEGYSSNGAPARTRDSEPAKIVKTAKVLNWNFIGAFICGLLISTLVAAFVAIIVGLFVSSYQEYSNYDVIVENVKENGPNVVGQQITVVDNKVKNGEIYLQIQNDNLKCEVDVVSNGGNPLGLVFCQPGGTATFSTPVPHDPLNLFYQAPSETEPAAK